jgi:hypothetical protein
MRWARSGLRGLKRLDPLTVERLAEQGCECALRNSISVARDQAAEDEQHQSGDRSADNAGGTWMRPECFSHWRSLLVHVGPEDKPLRSASVRQ